MSTEQSFARAELADAVVSVGITEKSISPSTIREPNIKDYPASDIQLASLLRAISQGDKSAFSTLYDLTTDQVFKLAFHILREPDAASEITLNVFMQVWDKAADYRLDAGKPLGWILTITRACSLDRLPISYNDPRKNEAPVAPSQMEADASESAALISLFSENRSLVQVALDKLTVSERMLLEAAYYEGLSESALAVRFDLTPLAVRTHLCRAMLSLKKDLSAGHNQSGSLL